MDAALLYMVRSRLGNATLEFAFSSAHNALEKAIELTAAGASGVHLVDLAGRHFYASQFENFAALAETRLPSIPAEQAPAVQAHIRSSVAQRPAAQIPAPHVPVASSMLEFVQTHSLSIAGDAGDGAERLEKVASPVRDTEDLMRRTA